MFDAFIVCGLSDSSPLVSLHGEDGLQSYPGARYRPYLLDEARATDTGITIPQHFPTVSTPRIMQSARHSKKIHFIRKLHWICHSHVVRISNYIFPHPHPHWDRCASPLVSRSSLCPNGRVKLLPRTIPGSTPSCSLVGFRGGWQPGRLVCQRFI